MKRIFRFLADCIFIWALLYLADFNLWHGLVLPGSTLFCIALCAIAVRLGEGSTWLLSPVKIGGRWLPLAEIIKGEQ